MYKTKEIYVESLSVNSSTFEQQLGSDKVPTDEIEHILSCVEDQYRQRLREIVEQCERDAMALEGVPSPLRLFIDCLATYGKSLTLSQGYRGLIRQYDSAWEDWM